MSELEKEIAANRLKPEDSFNIFPVMDCTSCGRANMPFGEMPFLVDYKLVYYCLNCQVMVGLIKPKGYVSLLDLEETGWSTEI